MSQRSRYSDTRYRKSNTQRRKSNTRYRKRASRLPLIVAGAVIVLAVVIALIVAGGRSTDKPLRDGAEVVTALSAKIPTMHSIEDYTAETDPNGELGKQGWYIHKTDWIDSRANGTYTLEVYVNENDAKKRVSYLEGFYGTVLGDFDVSRNGGYVLRVSNDLSRAEIEEYQTTLVSVIGLNDNDFDEAVYAGYLAQIEHNADSVTPFNDAVSIIGKWLDDRGGYYVINGDGTGEQFIPANGMYEGSTEIQVPFTWFLAGDTLTIGTVQASYSIDGDVLQWGEAVFERE